MTWIRLIPHNTQCGVVKLKTVDLKEVISDEGNLACYRNA